MKLGFLMIVLTVLDSGQFSAAFVNTQTLEECEQRAEVVHAVFESGDYGMEQVVCRASQAQFTPFSHEVEDGARRHAFIVSFDEEAATVEPVASCEGVHAHGEAVYCATSTQQLLP